MLLCLTDDLLLVCKRDAMVLNADACLALLGSVFVRRGQAPVLVLNS